MILTGVPTRPPHHSENLFAPVCPPWECLSWARLDKGQKTVGQVIRHHWWNWHLDHILNWWFEAWHCVWWRLQGRCECITCIYLYVNFVSLFQFLLDMSMNEAHCNYHVSGAQGHVRKGTLANFSMYIHMYTVYNVYVSSTSNYPYCRRCLHKDESKISGQRESPCFPWLFHLCQAHWVCTVASDLYVSSLDCPG